MVVDCNQISTSQGVFIRFVEIGIIPRFCCSLVERYDLQDGRKPMKSGCRQIRTLKGH